jgi:hypothetical protein
LGSKYGNGAVVLASSEADFGSFLKWTHFDEAALTSSETIALRSRRFEVGERKLPQNIAAGS